MFVQDTFSYVSKTFIRQFSLAQFLDLVIWTGFIILQKAVTCLNIAEERTEMERWKTIGRPITISFALALTAWSQSNPETKPTGPSTEEKREPGAAREIGAGAEAIGTGAAKGVGAVPKGTAKGAVDLVTLHPIDAGVSVGKGVATAVLRQ
jgi:hypothetical protein